LRDLPVWAGVLLFAVAGPAGCGGKGARNWVDRPPDGCATGTSGPTLDPGNAIRYAREAALRNLATSTLGVEVQSELRFAGGELREVTTQRTAGILANARIVAMWSELDLHEDVARIERVHALACLGGAAPDGLPAPPYPDWVLRVPDRDDRLCALGVSGPTRDPRNQEPTALDDGQRALAAALESQIYTRTVDDGRHMAHIATWMETSAESLAHARRATELSEQWRDDAGDGPLGLPGVLYGLVCVAQ
jgi:hypothetical protein